MPGRPVVRGRAVALARLLLGLCLVLVPLGGCSATPDPPPAAGVPGALPKYYDAQALIAAVTARQRTEPGVLITLNGTLDGAAGRRSVGGEGALRWDGDTASLRFDQRVGPEGATPRATALVRTGGRTWLRTPGTAPGRWIEVGLQDVPVADRADATVATNIAGMTDPLAAVRRYADASLVADAADETVDGVATVRYTIVVDLVRAAAAETDPAMRAQLTEQVRGGLTRISTVVWADAEQRPVRTRARQELPGAGSLDLVTGYRSWGTPVRVDPPPAAG